MILLLIGFAMPLAFNDEIFILVMSLMPVKMRELIRQVNFPVGPLQELAPRAACSRPSTKLASTNCILIKNCDRRMARKTG